jgi:hypothetical protein
LNALHLVRRFLGSLRPGGPGEAAEGWVAGVLGPGELALWRTMSGPDRRHAYGVARDVEARLGAAATSPVLAAALLHDVGKVDSGLRTLGRVVATVVGMVAGRNRTRGWSGRIGRYLRHPEIGAERLVAAGSDGLTVAWAREHHLPPERWTVAQDLAEVLKACDDD